MNNILNITIGVALALVIVGVAFYVFMGDRRGASIFSHSIMLASILLCVGIVIAIVTHISSMPISHAATPVDRTGYVVYLDGQEVDSDKIDLSLYSVRYDDEKKVAYATHRYSNNSNDLLTGGIIGYFLGTSTGR